MSGEPIRWRAVRVGIYAAIVGVGALLLEHRTHLSGTHNVIGIGIEDGERTLLGTAAVILFIFAALTIIGAFIETDYLARRASGPTALLMLVTVVGGALVFAAYRVQQDSLKKPASGSAPLIQVDCPIHGGTCYSASGQGGTYSVPPAGYDPINGCTWSDAGPNPAGTKEIYDCRATP